MGTTLDSIDGMINAAVLKGMYLRTLFLPGVTGSGATATSGYTSGIRFPRIVTMPSSFGSGVSAAYLSYFRTESIGPIVELAALEYLLLTYKFMNLTFTVDTTTDIVTATAHGMAAGQWIRVTTSGTLPAPLAINTDYYVITVTTNTFQLSLTSGGSPIDFTTTGTGTHTIFSAVTAGVSMPSKTLRIGGANVAVQTATLLPVAVVALAVTSTTPTFTVTYTDQDGNTGNTATLTMPTSPNANSVFNIMPHLASGDTGIRAVTNLVISAGTIGTWKIFGLLPLGVTPLGNAQAPGEADFQVLPLPMFPIEVNETIAIYQFLSVASRECAAMLGLVADI